MSHLIGYHLSYLASFVCIGATFVVLYCWVMFADTRKGRR